MREWREGIRDERWNGEDDIKALMENEQIRPRSDGKRASWSCRVERKRRRRRGGGGWRMERKKGWRERHFGNWGEQKQKGLDKMGLDEEMEG